MLFPEEDVYKKTLDDFPDLRKMIFKGKYHFSSINFDDEKVLLKIKINNDFPQWKNAINNKLTKLRVCFCLLNFYKNFDDTEFQIVSDEGEMKLFPRFNKESYHIKLMFDLYIQSYFHTYYSIIDISKHIVNLIADFNIGNNMQFNRFFSKNLSNSIFQNTYEKLRDSNINYANLRNDLTHNFPVTSPNGLMKIRENNYEFGSYSYKSSNELFDIILDMNRNLIDFTQNLEEDLIKFKI